MIYKDDVFYDGEWKNGLFNGIGIHFDGKGNCYEGEWLNNQRNGKGLHIQF